MVDSTLPNSIPECIFRLADERPNHLALVDPPSVSTSPVSYGAFKRRAQAVALHLQDCGVRTGDRVGLLSVGRSWWAVSDFGIMSIGAITVPIYPSLPASQIGYIIRHSGMVGAFVENVEQYHKLVNAHEMERLPIRFIIALSSNGWLDDVQSEAPWPIFRYSDWIADSTDFHHVSLCRLPAIERSHAATIVYTSGTTGLPKGVVLTHGNILANIEGIRNRLDLYENDVHLSYLPLSHIFERTCGLYIPLHCGSTISYAESIDVIAREFTRVRPTTFTTVPRLLEKVEERVVSRISSGRAWQQNTFRRALAAGERAYIQGQRGSNLRLAFYERVVFGKLKRVMGGRLRLVVSGGAPLAPRVAQFFWSIGIPVCEGYGMTETSPVVAFNSPTDKRLGTVGRKLCNVDIRLADDGELLVKGPSVTSGYFLNPDADAEAFTEEGYLRTGDIARLSEDGYLMITDRKKHLIVLSTGKKVVPSAIENSILESPYIDQVCLVGQGRKFISVVVVPDNEMVGKWLSKDGRNVRDPGAAVAELLRHEVQRTTTSYAGFERPKDIVIAEPFTVENGLLTPTLKVKANLVSEMYVKEIDRLYEQNHPRVEIL